MNAADIHNLDSLSDGALTVALELRRLKIGLMVDRGRNCTELFFLPPDDLQGVDFPAGLMDRVRPHVAELAAFIESQPRAIAEGAK